MIRPLVILFRRRMLFFPLLAGVGFFLGGRLPQPETVKPPGAVILIDPGHGGFDGGCGRRELILEKNLNLVVARRLAARLGRFHLCPALTRNDDRHLGPTHRQDLLARVATAKSLDARLVVCLHADWSWDKRRCGPVVFFPADSSDSRRLAELIQAELNSVSGVRNSGVPARDLLVIREVRRSAVLVEMGFLSNPAEGTRLVDPAYQEVIAEAISIGIINFLLEKT